MAQVQSPIGASGVVPGLQIKIKIKKTPSWKNKNNLMPDFLGFYKRNPLLSFYEKFIPVFQSSNDLGFGLTQKVEGFVVSIIIIRMLVFSPESLLTLAVNVIANAVP